ncbi:MAG: helix-turn-helix transcriptional regulator [Coprobacillus sp.]|nr:helix-turn-helix transcriptional regulator [Coprobacillus sp.]
MAKNTKGFFKMEMLLLKIISEGDCYGYQIVQTLDKISNGTIHIAEGTLLVKDKQEFIIILKKKVLYICRNYMKNI